MGVANDAAGFVLIDVVLAERTCGKVRTGDDRIRKNIDLTTPDSSD